MIEIAREIQASRELVRRALPGYEQKRREALRNRQLKHLREFAAAHPGLVREGQWTVSLDKVAIASGLSVDIVRLMSRQLAINPCRLHIRDRVEARARKSARDSARLKKKLRTERCVFCKRQFDWTIFHERERRLHGKRTVCSRICAQRVSVRTSGDESSLDHLEHRFVS